MFEVRARGRERTGHGGIERTAHPGEEQDGGDPGADLEAAVRDVLVRQPISREVKEQAERHRREPGADQ